ncbi:hypothetical protein [Oryza sativa Japonica Group]|uniref:Uncharacterized protein n=1 Tax=Oryza sativa subsp. japonica TaxID=39947 RepID=Q5VQS1_ORYSJ|nr:hypothetical protein [Oryza sativa Japonica Group]
MGRHHLLLDAVLQAHVGGGSAPGAGLVAGDSSVMVSSEIFSCHDGATSAVHALLLAAASTMYGFADFNAPSTASA